PGGQQDPGQGEAARGAPRGLPAGRHHAGRRRLLGARLVAAERPAQDSENVRGGVGRPRGRRQAARDQRQHPQDRRALQAHEEGRPRVGQEARE
ncbi:hypothetical protein BN1708_020380, partial [Verticillium longisporum]